MPSPSIMRPSMDGARLLLVASSVCWGACYVAFILQYSVTHSYILLILLGSTQLSALWGSNNLVFCVVSAALWMIDHRQFQFKSYLYGHMTPILFFLILYPPFLVILCLKANPSTFEYVVFLLLGCINMQGYVLIFCLEFFPKLLGLLAFFLAGVVCLVYTGPKGYTHLHECRLVTVLLSTVIMLLCGMYVFFHSSSSHRHRPNLPNQQQQQQQQPSNNDSARHG